MKPDYPYFEDCFVFQFQPLQNDTVYDQWVNLYTPSPLPLHIHDQSNDAVGLHVQTGRKHEMQFSHLWAANGTFRRVALQSMEYAFTTGRQAHIRLGPTGKTLNVLPTKRKTARDIAFAGQHILRAVFVPNHLPVSDAHRRYFDENFSEFLIGTDFARTHNTACGYLQKEEPPIRRLSYG